MPALVAEDITDRTMNEIVQANIRLTKDIRDKLNVYARKRGMTLNGLLLRELLPLIERAKHEELVRDE